MRRPYTNPYSLFPVPFLLAFLCLSASAYDGPAGLASVSDIESLPRVFDGLRCRQSSGNSGSFLNSKDGEYTMMDVKGAGQVCRLGLANASANARVRVFIDGEAKPSVDMAVTEVLSGSVYPFISPLVGGGCSYVPMPFGKSCRVTTDCKDLSYSIQYEVFDTPAGVTRYDACLDPRSAVDLWRNGLARPSAPAEKPVDVRAGKSVDILDYQGSGRIRSLNIAIPDLGDEKSAFDIYRKLRLRVFWDGSPKPAVDAPIGPFHCVWTPQSVCKGLLVGSVKPGEFYCHFPMPYAKGARVALVNETGRDIAGVRVSAEVVDSPTDAADIAEGRVGRFSTVCRTQTLKKGDPDYAIASLTGSGVAVGVSISTAGGQVYLEGDQRMYLDGGGYILLADRVQYFDGLRAGVEHGDEAGDCSSVFYYYDAGPANLVASEPVKLDSSSATKGPCEFTVKLKGDGQVTLRRRLDSAVSKQEAMVLVDGEPAGTWYDAGTKQLDSDFTLAYDLTKGKDELHIKIEPAGEWTQVKYTVLQGTRVPRPTDARKERLAASVVGKVTIPDGRGVAGVIVSARDRQGSVIASAVSCPDGAYTIRGLAAGIYDVRAESASIVPKTIYGVMVSFSQVYHAISVESSGKGSTAPPPAPKIAAKWDGDSLKIIVAAMEPEIAALRYAISRSKNESDMVGGWTDAPPTSAETTITAKIDPATTKPEDTCFVLAKCANKLGVSSEIAVVEAE